jgi:hypothetical protein
LSEKHLVWQRAAPLLIIKSYISGFILFFLKLWLAIKGQGQEQFFPILAKTTAFASASNSSS